MTPTTHLQVPEGVKLKHSPTDSEASTPGRSDSLASDEGSQIPQLVDDEPTWPSGWRAYASLFGGFLLMFNSWGIVNAFGTFLSFYQETLLPDSSLLLFNLIGSTQSFIVLIFSFVVGRLLDAGYSRYLTITGSVLVTLGMFLLSVVNGGGMMGEGNFALDWLVQGFVTGLGMACFFVTSSQVVATWFKKKKGFAIGIVATGASVAGLVYPVMLRFLIDQYGFITAVRWLTLLCGLTCILGIALANPNPKFPLRRPERWASSKAWIDPSAFRHAPFLLFTASISMVFMGFYGIFFNLEEWAAQTRVGFKGERPPPCPVTPAGDIGAGCITPGLRTYWLLAIMNGASSIGRLSSSYLCDRFGALNVHATVTFVASLLCLLLWTFASTLPAAIAFVVLFGAFSGSVIGLPPASMAAILGKEEQSRLGQWTGMMYSVAAPFALTGPVIEGYFIQRYGYNYITIQVFSGVCLFLSAALMAAARIMSTKGRLERMKSRVERIGSVTSSASSSLFGLKKEDA